MNQSKEKRGMRLRTAAAVSGLAVALLSIAPAPLHAQIEIPDSVQLRNWCRLAAQVLESGEPANKRPWAVRVIPMCGSTAARVVTSILERHRSDQVNSPTLEEAVAITAIFKDADVFTAALAIARDRAAGVAARAQSLRIVYYQLRPGADESYEEITSPQNGYVNIPLLDAAMTIGTPLPANAAEISAAAGRAIIAESDTPEPVRLAARWIIRVP